MSDSLKTETVTERVGTRLSIPDHRTAIDPASPNSARRPPGRDLSTKILALTVIFLLLGEVLIFVPSIARYRLVYLSERIDAAHLATLSLDAARGADLAPELEEELLYRAGVRSVTLRREGSESLMLGTKRPAEVRYDLAQSTPVSLILDAFATMWAPAAAPVEVAGPASMEPGTEVVVTIDEAPLREQMVDYAWRIVTLSLVLSAIVALLLYGALTRMIIRPLGDITKKLARFRAMPEDASLAAPPSLRADEIGVVLNEVEAMQRDLRKALSEKTRLAALGGAVSQVTHDLKNILATAVLITDRLERSDDPAVRAVAPRLVGSLDRAIRLCTETLDFARQRPKPPRPATFALRPLVDEVGCAVLGPGGSIRLVNRVESDRTIRADRDQLYRILFNLLRNAQQAMAERGGEIRISSADDQTSQRILVGDQGPGIAEEIRHSLFESFGQSTRDGGSGLGLAICRELARGHGGDIFLKRTGPTGTVFEIVLPRRDAGS